MVNFLEGNNDFKGSCQINLDCRVQYGAEYDCFIEKKQCYYCINLSGYQCEGSICTTNNQCVLKQCTNNICQYHEQSSMFWTIVFYIVVGIVSCIICCCCISCCEKGWKYWKKKQKQKQIDERAKANKSSQILMEIFEAMKKKDLNSQVLQENISENLQIQEYDRCQYKPMENIDQDVEFKTQNIQDYITHFTEKYGRVTKAYITSISNYRNKEFIGAIIRKTFNGYKIEYTINATFILYKLEKIQKAKKEQQIAAKYQAQNRQALLYPSYNNKTFDNSRTRQNEENMRGAAYMQSQEASRRLQQEQERQQQQFRENMQRQEQQQREYQRQQQMIAEQRYREAQQAQMKYNNSRW